MSFIFWKKLNRLFGRPNKEYIHIHKDTHVHTCIFLKTQVIKDLNLIRLIIFTTSSKFIIENKNLAGIFTALNVYIN